MQRYNPMTKCLETVKVTDSKKKRTRDKGFPVKKVHKSVKSALGNTYYIVEDDRGQFWVTTDKTGNGGGTMEFSMSNAVKTLKDYLKMDELEKKYGKQEGYKKWMRGEDRRTVDRIPVKKVLKALKSKLNVYYIIEDTDGRYWVTTKKDGSGGGTLEFSMSNAIKTAQNYIKMDELEAKYGKEEGYKKWMRGEDDKKTFELYKNTILSESKKRAEQFIREAEQDFDLTDKEVDELWKIFRNHF